MAASVPVPMARPRSAWARAAAFTPSPAMATRPASCSRLIASAFPAGSTPAMTSPMPSQRCCQVLPGNEASQRSSLAAPRCLAACVAFRWCKNGGQASRRIVCSSVCAVSGQHAWALRAGNCARSWLLRA